MCDLNCHVRHSASKMSVKAGKAVLCEKNDNISQDHMYNIYFLAFKLIEDIRLLTVLCFAKREMNHRCRFVLLDAAPRVKHFSHIHTTWSPSGQLT